MLRKEIITVEETVKFVADVHLGKLAKTLRMLGFDTAYKNSFTTKELVAVAIKEGRILLSRNAAIGKKNDYIKTFVVQSEEYFEQLKSVLQHFQLKNKWQPFSRCMVCNGKLRIVLKEMISELLAENTWKHFNEFWQCSECNRVYWKGSHYNRMFVLIERLQREL